MGANRKMQAEPGADMQERVRAGARKSARASGIDPGEVTLAARGDAGDQDPRSGPSGLGSKLGPQMVPPVAPGALGSKLPAPLGLTQTSGLALASTPGPRDPAKGSEVRLPPVSEIRRFNTTRLLPAKYSESVLTRITDSDEDLQLIFALDNATNERLLAEQNLRLGITARELVFAVPHYRIVNAAFTHPHPQGGRFSMPYRGAWYAGLELATAKAEVLFHRTVQFAEIGWQMPEELDYDQYLADFSGAFHDLRDDPREGVDVPGASYAAPEAGSGRLGIVHAVAAGPPAAAEFASCLDPRSYVASQQLAIHLLEAGSLGILYPSARRQGGNCIACFRPGLVGNVRKRDLYRLTWYPDRAATFVRSPRTAAEGGASSAQSPA